MKMKFRIAKIEFLAFCMLLVPIVASAISEEQGKGLELKLKADKYYQNEQYSEALTLYTRGMEAARTDKDDKTVLSCMGNIGNIYAYMDDYDRALHYFLKCYDMGVADKNLLIQQISAINIVGAYCEKGDLANARKFFKIEMSVPLKPDTRSRYYALCNQSLIAKTAGDYPSALYYQRKALDFATDQGLSPEFLSTIHNELGNILFASRKYNEAISEYLTADSIARGARLKGIEATACRGLYVTYNKIGEKEKAKAFKSRYLELSDSLFDQQRMNAAKNKLYDYEDRQNNAIIGNLTTRNNYLTASVVAFVLLSLVIAVLYVKLRKRNNSLLESEKLLVEKNKDLMKQNDENRTLRHQYIEALGNKKEANTQPPDGRGGLPTTEPSRSGEEAGMTCDGLAGSGGDVNSSVYPGNSLHRTGDMEGMLGGGSSSLLSDEQKNRLIEKINNVLEDVGTISSDDFSLAKLAQLVGSNTKYVSMVINDTYGKNFKTYLNEFRIREACRRLCDDEHYGNMTIQAIYRELGFKTATGFNQAFRKVCGMTPSQYQKLSRQQEESHGE